MKRSIAAALAGVLLTGPAMAQEGTPPPGGIDFKNGPGTEASSPHQDDAAVLLAFARNLREEKGCMDAAPAYRVVAGMGEGQEAAQHELGECLIEMKSANDVETALFRQEGEFWLTRAAFAGNARAQRRLAMAMASPANPLHNPKGSLMWSLIYSKNPTADLYGFGPLPVTLVPGLKSSLTGIDIAEAEKFAAEFTPIMLAKYEGPKRDRRKGAVDRQRLDVRPQGGRRRGPGVSS